MTVPVTAVSDISLDADRDKLSDLAGNVSDVLPTFVKLRERLDVS